MRALNSSGMLPAEICGDNSSSKKKRWGKINKEWEGKVAENGANVGFYNFTKFQECSRCFALGLTSIEIYCVKLMNCKNDS